MLLTTKQAEFLNFKCFNNYKLLVMAKSKLTICQKLF